MLRNDNIDRLFTISLSELIASLFVFFQGPTACSFQTQTTLLLRGTPLPKAPLSNPTHALFALRSVPSRLAIAACELLFILAAKEDITHLVSKKITTGIVLSE